MKTEMIRNLQLLVGKICLLEHELGNPQERTFGPNSSLTYWPTGAPKGTNEPEAAVIQQEDADEMIRKIEDQWEVIISMIRKARSAKEAEIMR